MRFCRSPARLLSLRRLLENATLVVSKAALAESWSLVVLPSALSAVPSGNCSVFYCANVSPTHRKGRAPAGLSPPGFSNSVPLSTPEVEPRPLSLAHRGAVKTKAITLNNLHSFRILRLTPSLISKLFRPVTFCGRYKRYGPFPLKMD